MVPEPDEVLLPGKMEPSWFDAVWDRCGGRCSGCGGDEKLQVVMIVPESAGGKRSPANGTVICRVCRIAQQAQTKVQGRQIERRPVNIHVGHELYEGLKHNTGHVGQFGSMSSLARFLIDSYVESPESYTDLNQYDNEERTVTKVNVWVDYYKYEAFKRLVDAAGLSVTVALRGLFWFYLKRRRNGTHGE